MNGESSSTHSAHELEIGDTVYLKIKPEMKMIIEDILQFNNTCICIFYNKETIKFDRIEIKNYKKILRKVTE